MEMQRSGKTMTENGKTVTEKVFEINVSPCFRVTDKYLDLTTTITI